MAENLFRAFFFGVPASRIISVIENTNHSIARDLDRSLSLAKRAYCTHLNDRMINKLSLQRDMMAFYTGCFFPY
jgi:hypothetical protein